MVILKTICIEFEKRILRQIFLEVIRKGIKLGFMAYQPPWVQTSFTSFKNWSCVTFFRLQWDWVYIYIFKKFTLYCILLMRRGWIYIYIYIYIHIYIYIYIYVCMYIFRHSIWKACFELDNFRNRSDILTYRC